MRSNIETPALVIDVDALHRNIQNMARLAKESGVSLRPHSKTHKCPDIAQLQVAAGAIGVCCQTVDEAIAMANASISGILITAPQPAPHHLKKIKSLLERGADFSIVVDDSSNVSELQKIAASTSRNLSIIVDFDVGVGRAGVFSEQSVIALVEQISSSSNLTFMGVQGYYGNLQQVNPFSVRKEMADVQSARLRNLLDRFDAMGLKAKVVTGSGTGTFAPDSARNLFTEIQPGSYIFLDSCYGPLDLTGSGNPFEYALFVATSVVSVNRPGGVIVNAGLKAFATDSGLPRIARGAQTSGVYKFMGDEHGAIDFEGAEKPKLGTLVEFIPSHVDPTVNHFDSYILVRGENIVGRWNVATPRYGHVT